MVTDYREILKQIDSVNPVAYGQSRNYFDGAVTRLSPYLSRGVLSTRMVLEQVLNNGFTWNDSLTLIKEFCWRDYFQRVWQERNVDKDLKNSQEATQTAIPEIILNADTAIEAIDQSIRELYETGYIHNHARLYLASLISNVAGVQWLSGARWMYYYLLDGDWASNACSWQWVAGTFSNKKYFANQENINRYSGKNQNGTFLDVSYDVLQQLTTPDKFVIGKNFEGRTTLPEAQKLNIKSDLPVCIYNYYNLDPLWHAQEQVNRILLVEPEIFLKYAVNQRCLDFMFSLSKNIPDIQIYIGSFDALSAELLPRLPVYFKEHPLNKGYRGIAEPRSWLEDSVTGFYPSFSSYWRAVEPALEKKYNR